MQPQFSSSELTDALAGKRTIGLMYDASNERRIWILADPLDSATILTLR